MKNNDNKDTCRLPPRPTVDVPWLVYTREYSKIKKKIQFQTFYTMSDSSSNNNSAVHIKSIPALRGKEICASYHGWLVLRSLDVSEKFSFSLWNSATSQSLDLPALPYLPKEEDGEREEVLSSCALTSPLLLNSNDDATSTCVLALFFGDQVFWCRPTLNHNSNINWITQRLDFDGKRLKIHHSTTVNGIIYSWADVYKTVGNGARQKLVSLRVDNADLNILTLQSLDMEIPDCEYPYLRGVQYLVESCGLIYCVGVLLCHGDDDKIGMIKVWELDLLAREWVEVKCLDGRAFFLGCDCCTWCWGSNDNNDAIESSSSNGGVLQGNCVYFIRDDDIKILYSYNLSDGCVTQFLTCENLHDSVTSVNWLSMVPPQNRLPIIQCPKEHSKKTQHAHIDEEKVGDNESQGRDSLLITKLPEDTLQLIAEYLNLFDYENFRASCKTLRSIILPLSERRDDELITIPMFIFFKDDDGLCQVIDLARDLYYSNHLQLDSAAFRVFFSKDGWLVIYNPYWEAIRYVNPSTRELEDLPFTDELIISDVTSIGISTNPDSPDCVTVLFENLRSSIYYIRNGEKIWSRYDFVSEGDDKFLPGISSPIYFAGAFYVLGVDGRLGEFKVAADGDTHWEVYESPDVHQHLFHSNHLVECDGDLVGVFIGYMGRWVQVFKFNLSKAKWITVESLGNYSLFISNPSSFSAQPTEVGMRNRIYVPRLKGGNSMVFYSLDNGSFHASRDENDSMESYYGTTEPLHCFWYRENYA